MDTNIQFYFPRGSIVYTIQDSKVSKQPWYGIYSHRIYPTGTHGRDIIVHHGSFEVFSYVEYEGILYYINRKTCERDKELYVVTERTTGSKISGIESDSVEGCLKKFALFLKKFDGGYRVSKILEVRQDIPFDQLSFML